MTDAAQRPPRGPLLARVAGLLLLAGTGACQLEAQPGTHPEAEGTSSPALEAAAGVQATVQADRVKIGGVSWYVDYEAAQAVAREQDKALWVHFGENPG